MGLFLSKVDIRITTMTCHSYMFVFLAGILYVQAALEDDITTLKNEVSALKAYVIGLEKKLNATTYLATQASTIPNTPPVAFTAHLSTTINPLVEHQHIPFDKVISNVGGAYNPVNGHFTAPMFGIYSFTLMVTNTPGHSASLTLVKNGAPLSVSLAHGTTATPSQWETSTVSVSVHLNRGDQVWAQNEAKFSTVETLDGYTYSSFTGFLANAI